MKERGMIFKAEMVRAILEDRKNQTRRIVKHVPMLGEPLAWCAAAKAEEPGWVSIVGDYRRFCPYGVVGDRLWVKETHAWADMMIDNVEREDAVCVAYKADKTILRHEGSPPLSLDTYAINFEHKSIRWRPSIFMPRWASRITLEITSIRVERLQEISEADAKAEGIEIVPSIGCATGYKDYLCDAGCCEDPRNSYRTLWDSINGKGAWERNDWVWVLEFRKVMP